MTRFALATFILFLTFSSSQAESYIRDYTYKASEFDSKVTSRTNALDQVKVLLLQEIGTHIRQKINISEDNSGNQIASEDIEAITAGLTKVEILDEKWNGESFYLKARVEANTDAVLNALESFRKDTSEESKKQLEALRSKQKELELAREEVVKLKEQLEQTKDEKEKKILSKKYKDKLEDASFWEHLTPGIAAFLPTVDQVAASQAMPIDGVWVVDTINKRIRIKEGRAFAIDTWLHMFVLKVQPGMVVIKDIKPLFDGEYSGDDLPLIGTWKAKLNKDRTISVTVTTNLFPVKYKLIPVELDNKKAYEKEMELAGLK